MMSLFDFFKLFFGLRNPCEVELHGLWVLYLHILQLVPQCHLSVDILSFIKDGHCTEHSWESTRMIHVRSNGDENNPLGFD